MDPESGEILYVLVSTRAEWIPVPLEAFQVLQREGQVAVDSEPILRIDQQRLGRAPSYEIGHIPDFTVPNWDAGLREYWEVQ